MQEKIVSTIVLSYKQFQYIYETIDSILKQDYPAMELIIADDGSPNFPEKDLQGYIEQNKGENIVRYKVTHDDINVGTVKNINRAIQNATGDFVKIIAGDDVYFDEGVFSSQVEFLCNNPQVMIVTGKTCECDDAMNLIHKTQVENTNKEILKIFTLEPKQYFKECRKRQLFPMVTQALCFRKEFFDKYGLYDEKYRLIEDLPMQNRVIINRIPIAAIDRFVVKHRADVGISANNELFSKRRKQYYLDLVNYVENELITHPEIFPPFKTKWRLRREKFRYEMSVANTKKEKMKIAFKNIDTAFWFAILSPSKALQKMKILLSRR